MTVSEAVSFQDLQFSTSGYVLTATGGGTLSPTGSAQVLVDSGVTGTISAPITGAGGLQVFGTGTLILSGASNTYSGTTTIGDGSDPSTLKGGATNAFSANSAVQVSAASTLDLGGFGQTIFSLADGTSGGGMVTNSGGTNAVLTIGGGVATAFSGAITDGTKTTGLTLTGAGTGLTLSGTANTYSGATTINSGATLALAGTGSIAASSQVAMTTGGTFDISQTTAGASIKTLADTAPGQAGKVALGGQTLTITNGSTTFSGVIADGGIGGGTGGGLNIAGGTQTLAGTNTYSGGTSISAGTLAVSADTNLGATSGGLTFGGGTLQYLAGFTSTRSVTLNAGGGIFDTNGIDAILSGNIIGAGGFTKIGTGELTLTGANTYTGATAINGGVLIVTGVGASLGSTAVTVGNLATLQGNGSIAGSVTVASGGTLDPGAPSAPGVNDHRPGTLTLGSLTLNSGSILHWDLGTANVVDGRTNDLAKVNGVLTINGGTLNVVNSGSFGVGLYQIINYTGALGGSGSLGLGTLPGAYSGSILMTPAGQVNLLVTGTAGVVQYWDGATTTGDGTIHGGTGTWNNSLTNWTTSTGAINAP